MYLDDAFVDCFSIDPLLHDLPHRGVLRFDYVSYDVPNIAHADLYARLQTLRQRLFRLKRPSAGVMAGHTPPEAEVKVEVEVGRRSRRIRGPSSAVAAAKSDDAGGTKGGGNDGGGGGAPPSPKLSRMKSRAHSMKVRAGMVLAWCLPVRGAVLLLHQGCCRKCRSVDCRQGNLVASRQRLAHLNVCSADIQVLFSFVQAALGIENGSRVQSDHRVQATTLCPQTGRLN